MSAATRRAAQFRWWYTAGDAARVFDSRAAALPPPLADVSERVRQEYLVGRHCAARALAQLGSPQLTVGRAADGSPQWPDGIVGSITHTRDVAWAVAAKADAFLGVGIDAEPVMSGFRARLVESRITTARELASVTNCVGGDDETALTLVFCAKEACFKCLYPHVRRVFDFLDVAVGDVDAQTGRITVTLRTSLSAGLRAGMRVHGQYARSRDHLMTCLWIEARPAARSHCVLW